MSTYQFVICLSGSSWTPGKTLGTSELSFATNLFLDPPTGDGQTIDPITGDLTVGQYTVNIIDSGSSVTSNLADSQARQQLISRPAFLLQDTASIAAGFINSARETSAGVYQFTIGDTQLLESTFYPFQAVATASYVSGNLVSAGSVYQQGVCFLGGPIIGGFAGKIDHGPWTAVVQSLPVAPDWYGVTLNLLSGPYKTDGKGPFGDYWDIWQKNAGINLGLPGAQITVDVTKGLPASLLPFVQNITKDLYQPLTPARVTATTTNITGGSFPGCMALVQTSTGTYLLPFLANDPSSTAPTILAGLPNLLPQAQQAPEVTLLTAQGNICLQWNSASVGPLPKVGEVVKLYGYFTAPPTADRPMYIQGHPVDIAANYYTQLGIPILSASRDTVKSAIPHTNLYLRITDSGKDLQTLLKDNVFGPFGFTFRQSASGSREFVSTRILSSAGPSESISLNDLASDAGDVWLVQSQDLVSNVVLEEQLFQDWNPILNVGRPIDDLVIIKLTNKGVTNSSVYLGNKQVQFQIEGMLGDAIEDVQFNADKFNAFLQGLAHEVFDRSSRGILTTELHLVRHLSASIGDQVTVTLPHLPNAKIGQNPTSQLGGSRIMQIVQQTNQPEGQYVKLWDAGDTAQAPVTPVFTMVTSSADPRRYFTISITNSASFINGNANIRYAVGTGPAAPPQGLQTVFTPQMLAPTMSNPRQSAGSLVWARMRAETTGALRPSDWTAWKSLQLKPLNNISGISASVAPSTAVITWTNGETDIPISVFWRVKGQAASSASLFAILPPLSTQLTMPVTSSTIYTVGLQHTEAFPYAGASSIVEYSFTSSAQVVTMPIPLNPRFFTGGTIIL